MKRTLLLVTMALFMTTQSLFAVTGREIMEKNKALAQPKSAESKVGMVIYRAGGRVEKKLFEVTTKKIGDEDNVLMEFKRPTRLKFLSSTDKDGDSEQWVKRRSGKAKRIAGSEKAQRFVHSHFYYEDLGTPGINSYTYKNLGTAKFNGENCHKIEAIKKKDKIYDKIIFYLRTSDYFIVKSEFYQNGKLVKYLENLKIKKVNGIVTPFESIMYMADSKEKTILMIKNVKYNVSVPSRLFRKEAL